METSAAPVRLLLVDDDEGLRETLAMALELSGYSVIVAATAEEGIQFYSDKLEVVLTDANMPGLQGEDLIRVGKQIAPHVPVIGISTEDRALSMLDAGADAFLSKPIEMAVLLEKISEVCTLSN
ncbi:MAG: DNA-binding response OmpR family regulator [Verrucomicrobiales bacterium]|jgi:DNA-binding response OmpR family regulator